MFTKDLFDGDIATPNGSCTCGCGCSCTPVGESGGQAAGASSVASSSSHQSS